MNARQRARMRDRKARKKLEAQGGYKAVEDDARRQETLLKRFTLGKNRCNVKP